MEIPFSLVDVFAERPLTGNPLAVVPHAETLDDATMRSIASELNQSETTFIVSPSNSAADWRLRTFTAAGYQVCGVGHNSVGASWWLAESGELALRDGCNHFAQETGIGLSPVEIRCKGSIPVSVAVEYIPPVFGEVYEDLPNLADALGMDKDEMLLSLPSQMVSSSAKYLLVPAADQESVAKAHPDCQRLRGILDSLGAEGCYLYCIDSVTRSAIAHARFFKAMAGIVEEVATGTAAVLLACQLVRNDVVKNGTTIGIEQGYEMKRPSLLQVQVDGELVRLIGRAVKVLDGMLRVG